MYAGPNKRATTKARCPLFSRAACRSWSSSPALAAKRDRMPTYAKPAKPKTPGSLAGMVEPMAKQLRQKERSYYISPDFATGLQRLGFFSIPAVVDVLRQLRQEASKIPPASAFLAITTQQRFIQIVDGALGSAEVALMRDPRILRKAFHLLGQNSFHRQNLRSVEGEDALRMVFLAGEVAAGVDAAAAEYLVSSSRGQVQRKIAPGSIYSPKIFNFIKAKALSKSDWRAMTLYLKEMSRIGGTEATARENYKLAQELNNMLEPGKQFTLDNPFLLQGHEPPWKILYEAAKAYLDHLPEGPTHDQVQADLETALRDGLSKYSDPSAIPFALRQSNIFTKHSMEWLELATQSAAGGDADSSLQLAFYHFRKDGWSPKNTNKKPTDWTGIEWLAVSAALSTPDSDRMTWKYLGLAHLLREHGYVTEGYSWIETAKENVAEAGLDPDKEWENYIDGFKQSWKEAEKDESMNERINTSDHFSPPILVNEASDYCQITNLGPVSSHGPPGSSASGGVNKKNCPANPTGYLFTRPKEGHEAASESRKERGLTPTSYGAHG